MSVHRPVHLKITLTYSLTWQADRRTGRGHTNFTTSGAHDVIPITSPLKNDLCTEELRDRPTCKSLDEVSLLLRKARFGCLFFGGEKGDSGADFGINFTLGGCSSLG